MHLKTHLQSRKVRRGGDMDHACVPTAHDVKFR